MVDKKESWGISLIWNSKKCPHRGYVIVDHGNNMMYYCKVLNMSIEAGSMSFKRCCREVCPISIDEIK